MNRQEHFRQVKLRNAVELKNKVDTAFELYSAMTEEEHCTMNLTAFCELLQARMSLPNWRAAYHVAKHLQMEYHVEFAKTSRCNVVGFTGHKHSDEAKNKMSIAASTRQLGKKRGPYRKTIERQESAVACNFSRINIVSDKIIIQETTHDRHTARYY